MEQTAKAKNRSKIIRRPFRVIVVVTVALCAAAILALGAAIHNYQAQTQALKDQAVITITATPADYAVDLTEENLRLADSKGATLADEDQDILDIEAKDNRITVATNADTPAKGTYRLYVKAGGSKEVYTTITVVNKTPTVTFKATGTLDVIREGTAVTEASLSLSRTASSMRAL